MKSTSITRVFTDEQILAVLKELGSEDYKQVETGFTFQTVCHHGDSYKLYYYRESQRFHCFTHCNCNYDLYGLVQASKQCSFFEALRFIQQVTGISMETKQGFITSEPDLSSDWELLERYAKTPGKVTENKTVFLPSTLPDYFSNVPVREWLKDGISAEAMQKFSIRFDVTNNAAIIPHRDKNGRLVGIRSRSFDPEVLASGGKYMPTFIQDVQYKHHLRDHLYGLDIVKQGIQRTGKLMICEAEKSVMQAYTIYGDNSFVVACCGSNISKQQRDLALQLGVNTVYIAFDKEYTEAYSPESDRYADKLIRLANLFSPFVTTYVLFDTQGLLGLKDSPTDRGRETLEALMDQRFEVTTLETTDDQ